MLIDKGVVLCNKKGTQRGKYKPLSEVKIKTPKEFVSLKIREYIEGAISSVLIKSFNLTYNTPLMHTESRKNHGTFKETKDPRIVLEG